MSTAKKVDWRKAHPAPVMLLFGSEPYFAAQVSNSIRDQLRTKFLDLEVNEVDASDYVSGSLMNLASPSLFAEPRLIVIDNLDRCTDAMIEDGKLYLQSPAPDTYLLLKHSGATVRAKALLDALRSDATAIEVSCAKLDKEPDRVRFVQGQFQEAERKITDQAVRALVDAFSADIAELASACSQLMVDSSEAITEDIVDRYFGGRVQTSTFKIADMAIAGRRGEAMALLRHGFNTGLDPVPMVFAIAAKLRQMARIHADPRATPSSVGMESWKLAKLRSDVQGWSDESLGKAIALTAEADAAAKGSERDPQYRIERLVSFLASKGKQP